MYLQTAGEEKLRQVSVRTELDVAAWAEKAVFEKSYIPEKILSGTGAGFQPDIAFQTSGFSLCHKMVKENKGISVTVDFVFDDMKEQGLRLIPFSDDVYEWKACMITRKEEAENEAVQCFLQFIQEWIGKIKSGEIIR